MDDRLRKALHGIGRNPAAAERVLRRLGQVTAARSADPGKRLELFHQSVTNGTPVSAADLAKYLGDDLAGLATHADPKIRAALGRAWDYDMSEDVRRLLLADPDPAVRESVAGYPHGEAPEDLHQQLLTDEATRLAAASYATLTSQIAEEFVAADDEELRAQVALNPTLPAELRDRLAEDPDPYVRAHVILRQDLPEDRRRGLQQALADAVKEPWSMASLALVVLSESEVPWIAALPLAERLVHLESTVPCFRVAVARSPDLPPEMVATLHDHWCVSVRRTAACRPDTPGDVLERLLTEHGEHPKVRPLIVEHPNFPPDAFIRFAAHSNFHWRSTAADWPGLPVAILTRLATDSISYVRAGVAGNPNTPPEILRVLVEDDDPEVCEAAGANPGLPTEVMLRLLDKAGL